MIIIIITVRGTIIYCSEGYLPVVLLRVGRKQDQVLGSQGKSGGTWTVEYAAKEISGECGLILCLEGRGAISQQYFVHVGKAGEIFDVSSGGGGVTGIKFNVDFKYQLSIRSRTDENQGKP
jgi:hypothetical protein